VHGSESGNWKHSGDEAVFSHAVRWEFCGHNPISRAYRLERGEREVRALGVRVSAKRQTSALVLSPKEVKLGLWQLEFRDQLSRKILKNDLRVLEDTGRLLHEKRAGGLYGAAGRHHRHAGVEGPRVAPGSRLCGDPGRLSGLIQRRIDVSDSFHEAGEVDFVDYSGSQ
jgi:hypothetical protein